MQGACGKQGAFSSGRFNIAGGFNAGIASLYFAKNRHLYGAGGVGGKGGEPLLLKNKGNEANSGADIGADNFCVFWRLSVGST